MRFDVARLVVVCALLVSYAALSGCASGSGVALPAKPNVLFIAVDDLNDWVGYLGGHPQAKTPNIDALAARSVAFTRAYSPAPACGPCRTALMYGLYPHNSGSYGHHSVHDPNNLLSRDQLPLNLAFQNNGYYTAGCGKIFHGGYKEPRGWDAFRLWFDGKRGDDVKSPGGSIRIKTGVIDTDDDSETGEGMMADWAIDQLNREHDKPFFIALGLYQSHEPWTSPTRYYDMHPLDGVQLPPAPAGDLDDVPPIGRLMAEQLVGFHTWEDHKDITAVDGAWRELVRGYLASCSFSDANVGRLLEALEQSPHADNTVVVLWGDHGFHLGEKSAWRKMTLWERGTRTPLVVMLPGQERGVVVDKPVTLLDIYPTLVEVCGLSIDQPLDGTSLVPLLLDGEAEWVKPAIMSHGPGNFAVRMDRWRLIRYADGSEELYDIIADPHEHTNLAPLPGHERVLASLRAHLPDTWVYNVGPRFKRFEQAFARPPAQE